MDTKKIWGFMLLGVGVLVCLYGAYDLIHAIDVGMKV